MKSNRLFVALFVTLLVAMPATLSAAPDTGATPAVTAPAATTPAAAAPAPAAPKAETAPASQPAAAPTGDDSATATAQAPEKQDWWQVLLAELLKLFLVIFVPVLSTLIVSLLKRWKINVEFEQVNSIATKAAGWAEQKALSALKEGKEKTSGAEKMKLALDFANGLANQYKLSAKATEKLQDLIESALGQEVVKANVAATVPAPTAPQS